LKDGRQGQCHKSYIYQYVRARLKIHHEPELKSIDCTFSVQDFICEMRWVAAGEEEEKEKREVGDGGDSDEQPSYDFLGWRCEDSKEGKPERKLD
jgi:hypothetical protein